MGEKNKPKVDLENELTFPGCNLIFPSQPFSFDARFWLSCAGFSIILFVYMHVHHRGVPYC